MNKMLSIKKLLLLTIFSLATGLYLVGQTTYNKTDKNGLKQGKWVKMWDNGMVRYEGFFKNDKPTGTFKYFYPSGKEKATVTFSDEGDTAHNISYHENGKKMAEGDFVSQKKVGVWKYFSDVDEKLVSEEHYKDGLLDGESITFYPDKGKPFENITYKNGVKNGKWIKYFPNGKKMTETTYKDGKLEGPFVNYDPDGKLIVKGQYRDGEMDGVWLYYDENGALYRKEVYNKGQLINSEK